MSLLTLADYLGVFVFAISGGLVAIRYNLDLFGILVVSLLPAVGGGTLRDLLLDVPVFWLNDSWVICIALLGGLAAIVYKSLTKLRLLVWADAFGLALFAMLGMYKTYGLGHGFVTVVAMGTITATAGGLIRDVVCGGPPLLLKEDIYAIAALGGCTLAYACLILGMHSALALGIGFLTTFVIRALAISYRLSLPTSEWVHKKLYRD